MKLTQKLREILRQKKPWQIVPVIVETHRRLTKDELEKLVNICCFNIEEEIPNTNFIEGNIRADDVIKVAKLPFVKMVHYDDVVFVMDGSEQSNEKIKPLCTKGTFQ